MFPLSFEKTIEVPIPSNKIDSISEIIMNILADCIFDEKPSGFNKDQYQIQFSGGFFRFVSSWNLLASIDHGVITVTPANDKLLVSYKLRFMELLIISSLMALISGVYIFSKENSVQSFFLIAGIWAFYFLPNFIITIVRFDNLIRSVIKNMQ